MQGTTILSVGYDSSYRIRVMESAGLVVMRSECSADDINAAFTQYKNFLAIAFHDIAHPLLPSAVSAARSYTDAPFVFFEHPRVDLRSSDVVVLAATQPTLWLKDVHAAIAEAARVRELSRQLQEESANVRAVSRALRAESARNRNAPARSRTSLFEGAGDDAIE